MLEPVRDEFLSEEDLALRDLSEEELDAFWMLWFRQAQSTNDSDRCLYSHGVFEREPRNSRTATDSAAPSPSTRCTAPLRPSRR